jgi:hypothetical protein
MAKDPGSTLRTARKISINTTSRQYKSLIGGRDRADVYRFTLARGSQLNLALRGLKANADLSLLNNRGRLIAQSKRRQQQAETLTTDITSGIYYIRVVPNSRRDRTSYRLVVSASANNTSGGNTLPMLSVNQRLNIQRGLKKVISGNLLQANDAEQSAGQLLYTLTNIPQAGQLLLNGSPLGIGGQFTQADVDDGRLSYASFGVVAQLTNTNTNEIAENIDGSNIIWNVSNDPTQLFFAFFDRSQVTRAFFYNGTTGATIPLRTNNTSSEIVLGVSGSNAVWNGIDTSNGDVEVFFYNGATDTSTQLTNNQVDEIAVGISGNNVVWNTFDGSAITRAFFYNGNTGRIAQLSHPNSVSDQAIAVSGDNIVWSGFDGNDLEVFLYNRTTNTSIQLTNNSIDDIPESISGVNVIWNSLVSRTLSDAFFYNGSTGQIAQLTTPGSTNESVGFVSGNSVVWNAEVNGSSEIFLYDATTNTSRQLTNNRTTNDAAFALSGSNVVYGSAVGNSTQLFFYNGSTGATTVLNDPATPAIFGGLSDFNLALTVSDGTDSEVFLYNLRNFVAADRFSFNLSDKAGGTVAGTFNIAVS